jgi:hypothetical protein
MKNILLELDGEEITELIVNCTNESLREKMIYARKYGTNNIEHYVNISERSAVERSICGALKASIHNHGPITKENISSAAKRVIGQLKCYRKILIGKLQKQDEMIDVV